MLTGIKDIINGKLAIQEQADLVLSESAEMDLDDSIIINEDGDIELPDKPTVEDSEEDSDEDDDNTEPNQDNHDNIDDHDIMGDDITIPKPSDDHGEDPGSINNDDAMNMEISGDDLPNPIGAQTGEPVVDDDEDIMNVELDIRSNTMADTLPVPPNNAGEAIASDDITTHHVDSGFGESAGAKIPSSFFGSKLFKTKSTSKTSTTAPDWLKKLVSEANSIIVNKASELFSSDEYNLITGLKDQMILSLKGEEMKDTFIGKPTKSGDMYTVPLTDPPSWYAVINSDSRDKLKKLMEEIVTHVNGIIKDKGAEAYLFSDEYNLMIEMKVKTSANEPVKESTATITEGISLAGGMGDEQSTEDTTGDPVPPNNAGEAIASDTAPDTSEGENPITAAVRDKVNEADTADSESGTDGTISGSKEELLKKLGNLTKNIEDVKKAVMDSDK